MCKLLRFLYFLSVVNLKPKLKSIFKLKLKLKCFLLIPDPETCSLAHQGREHVGLATHVGPVLREGQERRADGSLQI